jgi:cell division protein FtsL
MQPSNGITLEMGLGIVSLMVIALVLSGVKIYFANEIYYQSKEVNKIKREVEALEAEKEMLLRKAEDLEFKIKVRDTIFTIYESE